MTDKTASAPRRPFEIHPKVAVYSIVIVVVQALIAAAKAHGWFDLSADAGSLSASLGALAAYYVKG